MARKSCCFGHIETYLNKEVKYVGSYWKLFVCTYLLQVQLIYFIFFESGEVVLSPTFFLHAKKRRNWLVNESKVPQLHTFLTEWAHTFNTVLDVSSSPHLSQDGSCVHILSLNIVSVYDAQSTELSFLYSFLSVFSSFDYSLIPSSSIAPWMVLLAIKFTDLYQLVNIQFTIY